MLMAEIVKFSTWSAKLTTNQHIRAPDAMLFGVDSGTNAHFPVLGRSS